MTTLAEIDTQAASTLACSHLECASCGVVDQDWERMRRGYTCTSCGIPSESGRLHFPISIHILVDLIQQAYHSQMPGASPEAPNGSDVGTVLYFCTLREALLNHFLVGSLKAQNVPVSVIEKLLSDNKLAHEKFGGLFACVTGTKWPDAIKRISSQVPFNNVSALMIKAAELRNYFLHEGTAWAITRDVSTECINAVPHMVELFVALHNEYIHRKPPHDA